MCLTLRGFGLHGDTTVRLMEYQPPTRLEQLEELSPLGKDVAPDWAINQFGARLDGMAAEVVTASNGMSAQIPDVPQREPTQAVFEALPRLCASRP